LILVDTSVWINFLHGTGSKYQHALHQLIEEGEDMGVADIILTEILQGIKSDKAFKQTKDYLLAFPVYSLKDVNSYVEAAQIYRACRKKGLTIRRPIDCIIARIAIENHLILLHNDRDFDAIANATNQLDLFELGK